MKWWKTCMEYSYGEVDKKKSGWNKHETIKEYVDELYKYNFEVSFVGIVWIYLAHHHVMYKICHLNFLSTPVSRGGGY